jgi:hypothetical protein
VTHPANLNGQPAHTPHLGPDADEDQAQLIYRNFLIGGEPGSGKSGLVNTIVAHAALSTDVRLLRVLDNRGPELDAWRALADAFLDPNQHVWIGDGKPVDLDNPDQPKESP